MIFLFLEPWTKTESLVAAGGQTTGILEIKWKA